MAPSDFDRNSFCRQSIVFCDPGLRLASLALFERGRLTRVAVAVSGSNARGPGAWSAIARATAEAINGWFFDGAVIEVPEQYTERTRNREDVSELTGAAGALSVVFGFHGPVNGVLPKVWKGQIPKAAHHTRVLGTEAYRRLGGKPPPGVVAGGKLRPDEIAALERGVEGLAASLRHNAFDAVALGLWGVNR